MSDTRRRIPRDRRQTPRRSSVAPTPARWEATAQSRQSNGFLVTAPDSARTFRLDIQRDCRVTGLREHKLHRSQAKHQLLQDPDNIRGGKTRRYALRRETYLL